MTSHDVAAALLKLPPFEMDRIPQPPRKSGSTAHSGAKKAKFKGRPTSELAVRLHTLYGRREKTPWTVEEVELLEQVRPMYDPEEMTMLETYYAAEKKKGRDGGGMWRGSLDTLLRNWNTEIDRARAFWDARQKRLTRYDRPVTPVNVVPIVQPEPPVSEDEARARFRGAVRL